MPLRVCCERVRPYKLRHIDRTEYESIFALGWMPLVMEEDESLDPVNVAGEAGVFLDCNRFGFVRDLEAGWIDVREECLGLAAFRPVI